MVMEIRKSAGQIIGDDVRRKKLRRVGLGLFCFGILLMLGVTKLNRGWGEFAGVIGLTSLGVAGAGCVMAAVSLKCPICDSPIYKSGACKCQPSSAARAAHIDKLKRGAAGAKSGGGT
jgi:hypothetical protein